MIFQGAHAEATVFLYSIQASPVPEKNIISLNSQYMDYSWDDSDYRLSYGAEHL
jgi:hypothetical protein